MVEISAILIIMRKTTKLKGLGLETRTITRRIGEVKRLININKMREGRITSIITRKKSILIRKRENITRKVIHLRITEVLFLKTKAFLGQKVQVEVSGLELVVMAMLGILSTGLDKCWESIIE